MRIFSVLVLGGLAMAMTAGSAAAQASTGSVSGRLVFCQLLQRPLGATGEDMEANVGADPGADVRASLDATLAADPNADVGAGFVATFGVSAADAPTGPDLSDVTPGLRRFKSPATATLPAQNVEIKVVGQSVTARTDANGQFVLRGVPASQPMTVAAQIAPTSSLTLQVQNLIVSPGQTLDLGTVSLSGCAAAITQRPAGQAPLVTMQADPSIFAGVGDGAAADGQPALLDGQPAAVGTHEVPADTQPQLIEGNTE